MLYFGRNKTHEMRKNSTMSYFRLTPSVAIIPVLTLTTKSAWSVAGLMHHPNDCPPINLNWSLDEFIVMCLIKNRNTNGTNISPWASTTITVPISWYRENLLVGLVLVGVFLKHTHTHRHTHTRSHSRITNFVFLFYTVGVSPLKYAETNTKTNILINVILWAQQNPWKEKKINHVIL